MEDFKSQLIKDMTAFHNTAEFAHEIKLWYQEKQYIVPAIIDHSGAEDREKRANDYAEGIYRANCLVYIAQCDLGFVPQKDRNISVPAVEFGVMGDNILLIQTKFSDDIELNGYFILIPDMNSYEKILTSLGVM